MLRISKNIVSDISQYPTGKHKISVIKNDVLRLDHSLVIAAVIFQTFVQCLIP